MAITISNNGTLKVLQELKCKYTAGPLTIDYNGLVGGGYIENLRLRNNSSSLSFSYNNVEVQKDMRMDGDNGDVYIIKNIAPFTGTQQNIRFNGMEDVWIVSNVFMGEIEFREAENVTISSNRFYDTMQFKDCSTAGTVQIFRNNIIDAAGGLADVAFRAKHNNYLIVDNNIIRNGEKEGIEFTVESEAERGGPAEFTNNYIASCQNVGMHTKDVAITFTGNTIKNCGLGNNYDSDDAAGAQMKQVQYLDFSNNIIFSNKGAGLLTKDCSGILGGPPGRENRIYNNGTQYDANGGNAGIAIKDITGGGSGNLVIAGNLIYSNYSDGLDLHDPTGLVTIGAVSRNNEFYNNGRHGIGVKEEGDFIIKYSKFYGNTERGIGFTDSGSVSSIEKCLFYDNQDGIGFDRTAGNDKTITIKNNMIYENTISGIRVNALMNDSLNIYFNTIVDNTQYGIYDPGENNDNQVVIRSSIIYYNGTDINSLNDVDYCDIQDGNWGGNNIKSAPDFVDRAGDDYHINNGSPCENAATDVGVYDEYDDGARPFDGGYDIGADEENAESVGDTVTVSSLADTNADVPQGTLDQGTLRFHLVADANTANLSKVQIVPSANCTASYPDDYYNVRLYRDAPPPTILQDNFYEFEAHIDGGAWKSPKGVKSKCSEDNNYPVNRTRDGNTSTEWRTTDTDEPHYVVYEMNDTTKWNQVQVYSGANVYQYDIYVSTGDQNGPWTKVLDDWQVGGSSQWYISPPFNHSQNAKFLRVEISSVGGSGDGEYGSNDVYVGKFYYDENNQVFSATGLIETINTVGADYLVVVNTTVDADVNDVIEFEITDTNNGVGISLPDTVATPYSVTSAQYTITQALNWYGGSQGDCTADANSLYVDATQNFPDSNKTINCRLDDGNRDDGQASHWIRYRIGDGAQNKTVSKIRVYAKPTNPQEPRSLNVYLHELSNQKGAVDTVLNIGTTEGYYTTTNVIESNVNYITLDLQSGDTLPKNLIFEIEYAAY
jgi:hypothetical protein